MARVVGIADSRRELFKMRKTAILILSVLLFSYGLPLANAATETQFTDGTSTFTHVFSQAGDSPTPGVTLPYGADVQNVEFEIEGSASTSTWMNRTTNSDFGGAGTTGSSLSILVECEQTSTSQFSRPDGLNRLVDLSEWEDRIYQVV